MPTATVNGIKINYKVEGHGYPLVMIMGFSSPRSGWASQIPIFKKHYQVITFDNRGVGKSDKPEGPYTTQMMADDAVALMNHLGIEKANVMGASMGGMIAQELAINHPEKVNKLVLACTYCCKQKPSGDTPEQAALLKLPPKKLAAAMARLACNNPTLKFIVGMMATLQTYFISAAAKAGIIGQTAACTNHNTLDRLPKIKTPTLVIVGTEDHLITPASSDVIAKNIPGAKLVKVEGGSHMFFLENKEEFNQKVLDFLTK
ncbi:MAG: alpha/beta fold hydrolase [Dehalococcoidales bacterium]|nr:alpha/beta fold hydrolase [Dehalococcoidales bacterium]